MNLLISLVILINSDGCNKVKQLIDNHNSTVGKPGVLNMLEFWSR